MNEINALVLEERIVISVPKQLITDVFRDLNKDYYNLEKRNLTK